MFALIFALTTIVISSGVYLPGFLTETAWGIVPLFFAAIGFVEILGFVFEILVNKRIVLIGYEKKLDTGDATLKAFARKIGATTRHPRANKRVINHYAPSLAEAVFAIRRETYEN